MGGYSLSDAELKNKKADTQTVELDNIGQINNYLFIIYYVIAVCAILVIYFQYSLNVYAKGISAFLLLIYPFAIYYLEQSVLSNYTFTRALLFGMPN